MIKDTGLILGICAFVLYILGGLATFGGIALLVLVGDQDFLGWGQATGIAYLCICIGLCFSIMGVLFMRIVRNHGPR
ncbi:MAG: hypothetical protein P8X63_03485 [Desulfuromonadaceae bacterium]